MIAEIVLENGYSFYTDEPEKIINKGKVMADIGGKPVMLKVKEVNKVRRYKIVVDGKEYMTDRLKSFIKKYDNIEVFDYLTNKKNNYKKGETE